MQHLVFVVMAVCLAIVMAQTSTPILMFSKENYFNTAKISSKPLSNSKLNEVFTDLFTGAATPTNSHILNSIDSANTPSVVLVWNQPGLSTQKSASVLAMYKETTEYSHVKNAFGMYLPNAVQQDSENFYRSLLISSTTKDYKIESSTTCQEIVDFITESVKDTSSPLLRVDAQNIANFAKFDLCLKDISAALDTASNGKYVTIVQGDSHPSAYHATSFVAAADVTAPSVAFITARADGRVGPQYVTSQTLVALFASFALLAFLLFGIYHLMGIEGPLRYPVASHLPPATREY